MNQLTSARAFSRKDAALPHLFRACVPDMPSTCSERGLLSPISADRRWRGIWTRHVYTLCRLPTLPYGVLQSFRLFALTVSKSDNLRTLPAVVNSASDLLGVCSDQT